MFEDCNLFYELLDISKNETKNTESLIHLFIIVNHSYFFPKICLGILKIHWYDNLFSNYCSFIIFTKYNRKESWRCSSLKSLPDISKWDISNVEDIGGLFHNCSS